MHVLEDDWEGPKITNATWMTIQNSAQMNELLITGSRNRNNTSNEFGKLSSKATAVFTLELMQTSEVVDTRENLILISRMNFFDLPGSEIMLDDPETIRVRQGSTLNKSIISFTTLIKDLYSNKNEKHVLYEQSALTHLMKDCLGGNAVACGIFTVQNGDPKGSSLCL